MAWKYKEIRYTSDLLALLSGDLVDFPLLISRTEDSDIQAECSGASWDTCIKFMTADGMADLSFGLYQQSFHNPPAGNVLARVKVTLFAAASVGDPICRLYYSATETGTEDKASTVSDYARYAVPGDYSGDVYLDWKTGDTYAGSGGLSTSNLSAGSFGYSLEFDGVDDVVSESAIWSHQTQGQLTLECRVAGYTTTGSHGPVVTFHSGGHGLSRSGLTSQAYYGLLTDGGGFSSAAVGGGSVFDNDEHDVAVSYDGSNAKLYVDGNLENTSGSISGNVWSNMFRIGNADFAGKISEVRVLPVARDASYVAASRFSNSNPFSSYTFGDEETEGGGPDTYTATAALTGGSSTLSASATFAAGTKTATAALSKSSSTIAASLTFTTPVYTATAALSKASSTLAASATFAAGTKTATAGLSSGSSTLVASATFSPGTKTATASLSKAASTLAASATFTTPVYTAAAALTSTQTTLAASATFTSNTRTASASLTSAASSLAASATFAAGTKTATAALSKASSTLAVTATFTSGAKTAIAGLSSGNSTLAATATFAPGTKTATGTLTGASSVLASSATFVAPAYTATATLASSSSTLASVVITSGLRTATAALASSPSTLVVAASATLRNAQLSIRVYGAGVAYATSAELSIKPSYATAGELSIAAATIAPPDESYAVHVGQGVVFMTWTHPTPEKVDHYEVYACETAEGNYQLVHRSTKMRAVIRNVPIGFSVYFRVVAIGKNRAVSTESSVFRGRFNSTTVTLAVTGIAGSIIPKDAIFTKIDEATGTLIAFAATDQVTL